MAKICVLVGSLRKGSFTRKVAKALIALAPESLDCTIVEIGDLPLYNEDLDRRPPAAWSRFRAEVAARDAVLFLTPEYNRSIPACIKNAIDVASKPQGENVLDGMPAGVVSVTPYKLGAFGANHALRQTLVFLNMPVLQQPEAYIGDAAKLFDKNGALTKDDTRTFFTKFMQAFAQWVETIQHASTDRDFDSFMQQRKKAARAYVSGDATPLDRMVARAGKASFFPPNGGSVEGAKRVAARYDRDAKAFAAGGQSTLEVLQSGSAGDLAFWTGFQEAKVKLGGKSMQMKLRITEIFRFEEGGWKMVHRHADTGAGEKN